MLSPSVARRGFEMIAAKQKMWNSDPAGRIRSAPAHLAARNATKLVRATVVHRPPRESCGITDAARCPVSIRIQKVAPTLSWASSRSTCPGTRPYTFVKAANTANTVRSSRPNTSNATIGRNTPNAHRIAMPWSAAALPRVKRLRSARGLSRYPMIVNNTPRMLTVLSRGASDHERPISRQDRLGQR